MLYFQTVLYKFCKNACFFNKYAMKYDLQNNMQLIYFLMTSKNIDFDRVCHVILYM